MRIVYFGTPDFAVAPLRALSEAGHELVLVVTQPDKPRGRGHAMQFPPVKEEAIRLGIPVAQPERARDVDFIDLLRAKKADLFVVTAFGQLLPKEILERPRYGCVNIHASLLPAYRGAAPIQWAIIDGQRISGITTMQMDEGLDTGDILRRYPLELSPEETGGSLFAKLEVLGAEAILDTVKGLESGSIVPEKQGETTTAYAKMLRKEMGNLDFSQDAAYILRLIRGLDPWPGTFSYLKGKMIKIRKAEHGGDSAGHKPGEVLAADERGLLVQTGDGALRITELQPEGKKPMAASAWLRGTSVCAGDCFTGIREAEN